MVEYYGLGNYKGVGDGRAVRGHRIAGSLRRLFFLGIPEGYG